MNSTEEFIAIFATICIALVLSVRWFRSGNVRPDPWETIDTAKSNGEPGLETCVRCSTPQEPGAHFCPHCGAATGPYNNLMPYEQLFSVGEVLRNGVTGRVRLTPFVTIGYVLMSFAESMIFAPVFLFRLFFGRDRAKQTAASEEAAAGDSNH